MARKASGPKVSLKALLPLVMIYINYQIDYKSETTLKVLRGLFMVSLTLVRLPRSGGAGTVSSVACGAAPRLR